MPALLLERLLRPSAAALPIAVTIVLWASAFPGIRAALQGFSPAGLASLRFAVAAAILLVLSLALGPRLPRGGDLVRIGFAGGLGIAGYNLALNAGELTVSAGAASFLINTAPLFTALIATATLGERIAPRGWVGMGLSLIGVGLIGFSESDLGGSVWGAVLVLAAALMQAIYFVLQKPLIATYSPFAATAFAVWAGALLLAPWLPQALAEAAVAPPGALFSALYLGVFPAALAYYAWSHALAWLPAGQAASWLYLVPPTATAIGLVWPGEMPPPMSLLGGAVALAGVLLVNRRRRT
ncbi:MAG: DMT family transporter [Rhodospirillales bacterium]|nr:DMT family transporter [Rhodospirillales bacterium]